MASNEARIVLTAQNQTAAAFNSVKQGLSGVQRSANLLKSALGTIGFASGAFAMTRFATQAIQFGDSLNKAAQKAGLGAEAISELAFAAKQSGVELGSLSTSLRFMQRGLSEAASGTGETRRALTALGLSVSQLRGLAPEKQFELLADRISRLPDPADRARAAMMVFGRAGADLLPLMSQGAEGIRKLREEAQQVGQSFNQDQLDKLTAAQDAVSALKAAFSAFAVTLTAEVAPALTQFFNQAAGIQQAPVDILNQQIANAKAAIESFTRSDQLQTGAFGRFQPWTRDSKKDAELKALIAQYEALLEQRAKLLAPVASSGESSEVIPGFVEGVKELTGKALEEWKRYQLQASQIAQDAIRSMSVVPGGETDFDAALAINKALGEGSEEALKALDAEAVKISSRFSGTVDQMTVFAEEGARRLQAAFADFLFDPFSQGLKGMLKGFIDVMRRMVAEAAAAQILKGIGAMFPGGSFLGTLFGGARALGGPVTGGRSYLVGERGPEMFVPSSSGSIVPNGAGGSVTVSPTYNIDARGATTDLVKALPGILAENNRRIAESISQAMSRSGMRAPVF